ncbi:unnamed protein product [Ilex paraguariensis]|uniref:Uncharacterized protein n=1 Tax=Ilex paraguariensis TaxID=185542 RepID=A0ABC8R6J0_9AQUA
MVFQELICGKGIRTQILLLWNDGWRRWSSCFALDCIDCSLQFCTDLEHGVVVLLNDLKVQLLGCSVLLVCFVVLTVDVGGIDITII